MFLYPADINTSTFTSNYIRATTFGAPTKDMNKIMSFKGGVLPKAFRFCRE